MMRIENKIAKRLGYFSETVTLSKFLALPHFVLHCEKLFVVQKSWQLPKSVKRSQTLIT